MLDLQYFSPLILMRLFNSINNDLGKSSLSSVLPYTVMFERSLHFSRDLVYFYLFYVLFFIAERLNNYPQRTFLKHSLIYGNVEQPLYFLFFNALIYMYIYPIFFHTVIHMLHFHAISHNLSIKPLANAIFNVCGISYQWLTS